MSTKSQSEHRRWRDRLPGRKPEPYFRWRGHGVSRLENLADGVFAFSVTLLVVAQQVPNSFSGLMHALKSFPAFAASFAILMFFWNVHYKFFRRYGLEDFFTRSVNYIVLLLVLFSVYPLKFLFNAAFQAGARLDSIDQLYQVYQFYGCGIALIWALFGMLYGHAYRLRVALNLSPIEIILTRLELCGILIQVSTCLVSIMLAQLRVTPWLPGAIYASLGFTMWANGAWHGRQVGRELERQRTPRGRNAPFNPPSPA